MTNQPHANDVVFFDLKGLPQSIPQSKCAAMLAYVDKQSATWQATASACDCIHDAAGKTEAADKIANLARIRGEIAGQMS